VCVDDWQDWLIKVLNHLSVRKMNCIEIYKICFNATAFLSKYFKTEYIIYQKLNEYGYRLSFVTTAQQPPMAKADHTQTHHTR
jgi:hypothetical protein